VAAQEEQAVAAAVQLLYGVAPPPTEKILRFLQFRHLLHPLAAEAGAAQHPAPAAVAEPSSEPRREPSRARVRIKRREEVMGEGEAPSAYTAGAAAAVAAAE
jgi:hypothetical protein